jgi:putative (di)nucleoside polyphosphate hydrolase
VIDEYGFRLNVGIILANAENKLFWGRRIGNFDAWQFPQGGIQEGESLEEALYRELHEELGLLPNQATILGVTTRWLKYYIPRHLRNYSYQPMCLGQKQKWFLLRFTGIDAAISLHHSETPEFSQWQWVDYWHPLKHIVGFKKSVYRKALTELSPLLFRPSS